LTPAEQARVIVGRAAIAEEVLVQQRLEDMGGFGNGSQNPKGGRPPKAAVPDQVVADYLGVDRKTVRNAKAHVAAVDRYPELEPLPQERALATAKTLDSIPEVAREPARQLIRARRGRPGAWRV